MRLKPHGRNPHGNNLDIATSTPSDDTNSVTPDGGQVVLFGEDGLVCHLHYDSLMYDHKASDKEYVHFDQCVSPVVHTADMDNNFVPDLDGYLIAHVGEEKDYMFSYEDAVASLAVSEAENCRSMPNLPPSST
jgi:hypothetical protein